MINFLKNNTVRYKISIFLAFILALLVNDGWGQTDVFILPLVALYVMQTSIGRAFYEGMKKSLIVFVIITLASLFVYSINLFILMMHDALLGAVIGILANLALLPRKPDVQFRAEILPIINCFKNYFLMVSDQLLQQDRRDSNNVTLEQALLKLPEWVYARGFNNALQGGYQFFLMQLEKMSDVLMSMHHLTRYPYDETLIAKISPPLLEYIKHVNQFFLSVVTVLELKALSQAPSDLEEVMTELQNKLFTIVPASLELLDMRRDYVYLAAFIYNLKDLRHLLLKMGEALR